MPKNEYIGKRVAITLPEDIYELLVEDAKRQGLKVATRASQIITLALHNDDKLKLEYRDKVDNKSKLEHKVEVELNATKQEMSCTLQDKMPTLNIGQFTAI